jgi:hypothetical protein
LLTASDVGGCLYIGSYFQQHYAPVDNGRRIRWIASHP